MTIYLCRHGQTTGDIEDRYGGAYDDHLSKEGLHQAHNLADNLKDFGIQKIITSSLIRAKETGEILSTVLNAPTESDPGLNERNIYGVLSGKVRSDAKNEFPDLVEIVKDYRNTIPGAESYVEAKTRMLTSFNKIIANQFAVIAIVTHGGTIKCISRELLGREIKNIQDCGYGKLEAKGGKLQLLDLNGIEVVS